MPQILLIKGAGLVVLTGIGQNTIGRVPAADARRLHAARGCQIGRPKAHAMHAWRGSGDLLDVLDPFCSLQNGMDEDRLFNPVPCFELRQKLVEIVDIPHPLDLRQHDHIELVADRRHNLSHVIQRPRAVQAVDPRPEARRAEIVCLAQFDEPGPRRLLGIGRNGILQVAQHHIDVLDQIGHLGPHFLDMRRHKMDHPLKSHRQFRQRFRCANGKWLVKARGQFHAEGPLWSK